MNVLRIIVAAAVLSSASLAAARDDRVQLPVADAMYAKAATQRLDPKVPLYFGKMEHPPVARVVKSVKVNKKTNAFGKDDKAACEWVFLSAVLDLQEQARGLGGDAVVNIESNYKNVRSSSETLYTCGAGAFVAGVAFVGDVVKFAQ